MEELIRILKKTKTKEDLNRILDYLKENLSDGYIKHSKDLLQFILDCKIEKETQTSILLLYTNLFFSKSLKPEQMNQIPYEQIFRIITNSFYNEIPLENFISVYYSIYFPKKINAPLEPGSKVDFLQIKDSKYYSWTQGIIVSVDEELKQYVIQSPLTNEKPQSIKWDSYRIQELNSYSSKDFEWRLSIAEGDIIDALDIGNRWNKSTILSRRGDDIIVALRVYQTEAKINYIGYSELYDFTCSIYDSRIRPKGTFSLMTHFPSLYAALPRENSKFNPHAMYIPFDSKNYIIPKQYDNVSMYSLEFITIANVFISKLIEMISKDKKGLLFTMDQIDYFLSLCHIVFNIHEHLHPHYAIELIPEFIFKAQEYLITFSKSETRNFTKTAILSAIQQLKSIMEMAYYPWEISSHFSPFEISFGMNCLSSSIFEKQLLGLKIISDSLSEGTKQYSSNEKLKAISSLLIKDHTRGNIFDILFKSNFHSEIIKKASEVALLLFKLKVINKEEIDQLYLLMHKPSIKEVKDAIYEILSKGSKDISPELLFHTINKLYEINKEDITTDDIHLFVEITKHIPEICWYETAVKLLDFLFEIIVKDNHDVFIKPFCELLSYSDKNETSIKIYLIYFNKIIQSLSPEMIYVQLMLLSNLLQRIPKRIEDELLLKAVDIIFSNRHKDAMSTMISDYCKSNNSKTDILSFVIIICEVSKNNSILSNDFLQSLFIFYIKENNVTMVLFFNWLKEVESKHMFNKETIDFLFSMLKENSDVQKDIKSNPSLHKEILNFFWHLFVSINALNPKDFKSNQSNPLELKYGDVIWKLLINSVKEESLINCYMEMYSLPWITQKERSAIWNQAIKRVFDALNEPMQIEESIIPSSKKENCIRVLSNLIESSDVFGTANSRPHSSLMESSELKIEISNLIDINNEYTFNLTLPSHLTLFDLRLLLSEKIKLPVYAFGLYRFFDLEICPRLNGRTLDSLLLSNSKLNLKKSEYITIEKKPLTIDNNKAFTPEGRKVFESMFKAFSSNGKMTREQNCKLVYTVIGGSSVNVDDSNVKKMFEKDDDGDGLLTEVNVAEFYLDAIQEGKDEIVWKNINNFNYRNDLRHISEPFEKDIHLNEDKLLMPRVILSKDSTYFDTLFDLQKDRNKDISEAANNLINKLETHEVLYNEIVLNASNEYLTHAKDNVFKLIYIFEIIFSVINPKLDKEGTEPESLFLKSFITSPIASHQNDDGHQSKSSFENVIEIFIQHMAQIKEDNERLIKLYSLELKLIKTCLVSLIKNADINKLLTHFDKEQETLIPVIPKEDIANALGEKPQIQLDKMVQVLIGNMSVLNNKEKLVDIKRPSLIYSFQILTIILLAYEDIDLQLNDFLLFQLKTEFGFAQRLSYVLMKIFFIQYSFRDEVKVKGKESIFLMQNESILTKEVFKNNSALNKYNPIYVFKAYQEIIVIKQYSFELKIDIIKDIIKELTLFMNVYTEDMIIGYCSILSTILASIDFIPDAIQEIVIVLINKFLVNDDVFNYPFTSCSFIKEVYGLLSLFIAKSTLSLLMIFSNTKISELLSYTTNLSVDRRKYDTSVESKSSLGYIGIKNLGAICYMISILQQFFFIKPFKYCINETQLPLDADTPLFQLKKMFSFLMLSNRGDYSPHEFANSFKDSQGQSINIKDQYDAQEFLSGFLDTMEFILRPTQFSHLLQGVFGGESCSQLFCKNQDCDKISNRFENMAYLSLEIKQMNTLDKSLMKYISEEQIDDFYCEKCKKKTAHMKRVSINKLPNVLIIHLQRIAFDYETFQMEKIDSKLEYPKELNLKNYCTETLEKGILIEDDEFNDRVYEREDDYYKYNLCGVVIHTGTAQYGHYFSIVKAQNADANANVKEKWVKFNDSTVSEYQIYKLDEDTFGGSDRKTEWLLDTNQNAYLLFYEREKKTKIAYVVNNNDDCSNYTINSSNDDGIKDAKHIKALKNEIELNKELDVFSKSNGLKDDNMTNQHLFSLNKEIIELVDYNTITEKEVNRDKQKMLFYDEVMKDNTKFNNDKKIYTKNFNEFIEASIKKINNSNNNLSDDEVINLYMKIHNIVLSIITKSYYLDNLQKIIEGLINIIEAKPQLSLLLLNEILSSEDKWVSSFILVQDATIGSSYALYISNIIIIAISSNDPEAKLAYVLIDYYLDYFPNKLSRKWSQMCAFLEIFNHLSKSTNEMLIEYLINNEIIKKMGDFFLGKDSPYYIKDERTEIGNKTNQGKFAPLLSTISNIVNCHMGYVPNARDNKCIGLKTFYQKALIDEYDNASLGRIMAFFMLNNEEFTLKRLNEMIPIINNANSISSYKRILDLIEPLLLIEDNYTQLRIENLIGKPQLYFTDSKVCINYLSPLINDKETIISKVVTKCLNTKDFVGLTKTIFDLLSRIRNVVNYVKDLPHSMTPSNRNGLLKAIKENCFNAIEAFNLKKDDKFKETITEIEKLYAELNEKLEDEDKLNNEQYQLQTIHIKRECAKRVNYICHSEDITNSLILIKGQYTFDAINDDTFKEIIANQTSNCVIYINQASYYLNNLSILIEDKALIRELQSFSNEIETNEFIRYFLINTSNINDYSILLQFNSSKESLFPKSAMAISIPRQSLKELIVIITKVNAIPESITIQSTIENSIVQSENQSQPILLLPSPNDHNDVCTVTCQMCGKINLLDNSTPELKCKACQIFLFQ